MDTVTRINHAVWQVHQQITPEIPLYLHAVVGAESVALVDGGLPTSAASIRQLVERSGGRSPRYLANTHPHHDHIGTFRRLRAEHRSLVVAAAGAVEWIEDVERNLAEFALHQPDLIPDTPELRAELEPTYDGDCYVDLVVGEGALLRLGGGIELEALELPGHMDAELGWFERGTGTLVLGDVVTGIDWPIFHGHVDPQALRTTLSRLRALVYDREVSQVVMSHYAARDSTAFVALLDNVQAYLDRVWAAVREPLGTTPVTLRELWLHACRTMGKEPEFRSLAMVRAHIAELIRLGEVRRAGADTYVSA